MKWFLIVNRSRLQRRKEASQCASSVHFLIVCITQKRRPPKSVCRQCPDYTGAYPAHGDGSVKTTLGNAAAAVGSAVAKVVGMVTGKIADLF